LIRTFLGCQRTSDYHILLGECTKATSAVPYAPIREALKKGFEAKDPATVNVFKEMDEARRRALVQLIPQFDRFGKVSRNHTQAIAGEFLAKSIFFLLQGLSRQLPVVLVIEDLNSCDKLTLNLIKRIQQNLASNRILIITTNNSVPPSLQITPDEPSTDALELKPFSFQETGFLLEEIFRKVKISSGLQKWVYSNSGGIPLQAEQLLKLLITEGSIEIGPYEVKMRS